RANPDAGTRTGLANIGSDPRHVRKLLVAAIPCAGARRLATAARLPAIVNDDERTVIAGGRKLDEVLRVGTHRHGAVVPVCPVPVVAAVHGRGREAWSGTHLPAKGVDRGECGFSIAPRPAHHVAHVERTTSELHSHATAAHIRAETHAPRVGLPVAERARSGAHAVRMRARAVARREVPGHDAIGIPRAPFEIAVRALPRITEHEPRAG